MPSRNDGAQEDLVMLTIRESPSAGNLARQHLAVLRLVELALQTDDLKVRKQARLALDKHPALKQELIDLLAQAKGT